MTYYMPTKVFCENGCLKKHGGELEALGKRALIITGKHSSRANGSLNDVLEALSSCDITYLIFDDVEENPSVETVIKAAELGAEFKAEFVIGVGGGSPIDAAKAVALMLANRDKSWEYLYEAAPTKALPVAAVPTTCGTGSEVTGVSVITRHDLKTKVSLKHKVFPRLAFIDGKYILDTPRQIIVNTSIDAFSHLIESGVNTNANEFSDMLVIKGLQVWSECLPYLKAEKPIDEAAADKLMQAACLGGMAIAQTGTTIPHALSYMLTYEASVPHGAAVGAFQANYLRYADKALRNRLLSAAGIADADELEGLIKELAPINVSRELLERSAESVLAKPEKLALCPYKLDREMLQKIISL